MSNIDYTKPFLPAFEGSFINDKEKMRDFDELSKEDFLKSYSFLTEAEYNATVLDVKLYALIVNLAVMSENAEQGIESYCKSFNDMVSNNDNLSDRILIYEWNNTKSLETNLTKCITSGKTDYLQAWLEDHNQDRTPFTEAVCLQLAELIIAISAQREGLLLIEKNHNIPKAKQTIFER